MDIDFLSLGKRRCVCGGRGVLRMDGKRNLSYSQISMVHWTGCMSEDRFLQDPAHLTV